jgi:3-oxoacyl-[acyl-carrier protein] reductase
MTQEFSGKVALVTGGSRGIGRAICRTLVARGAAVAINYHSDEKAAQTLLSELQAQGARCALFRADVADPDAVTAMCQAVEAQLGPIDLLATSAGIAHLGDHTQVDLTTWQRIMRVNVDGTFLPVMAVKDGMIARGYGRIVCVASIAGLAPRAKMLPYSTSKAAVIAFARSCAAAFGPAIRVNSVAPGLIETDMTVDMDPAVKQAMRDEAFLKCTGQPEDIAEAVAFLLSDRANFMTGQTLVVDGGRVTLP